MILQPFTGTGFMKNVIAATSLGPHNRFSRLVNLQANAAFPFTGSANAANAVDKGQIIDGVGFDIIVIRVIILLDDLEDIFNGADTFRTMNGSLVKEMRQCVLGHCDWCSCGGRGL